MPADRYHAFAGGDVYPRPVSAPGRLARRLRARAAHRRLHREIIAVWEAFDRGASLGPGCWLGPRAWCANDGPPTSIRFGAEVVCRGLVRRESFGDGTIVVGDGVYIGDDCLISCCHSVEIGWGTLIGHGVQIFDNDSHPLDAAARRSDWSAIASGAWRPRGGIAHAPVRIGHSAWLGFNAIVLKGVSIGEGAVIAAGSVVTKDVGARTVAAGNPASAVRTLTEPTPGLTPAAPGG